MSQGASFALFPERAHDRWRKAARQQQRREGVDAKGNFSHARRPLHPVRFRAVHEEVVKLDQDFGSAFSGILTDDTGKMRALWGSYAEQQVGSGSLVRDREDAPRGLSLIPPSSATRPPSGGQGGARVVRRPPGLRHCALGQTALAARRARRRRHAAARRERAQMLRPLFTPVHTFPLPFR